MSSELGSRLEALLREPGLWRGHRQARLQAEPSGIAALDALLPGGGWPLGALSELLLDAHGIGELQLLLPTLARLSQSGRCVAMVDPPWLPYPPALAAAGVDTRRLLRLRAGHDAAWAAEQCLRSGHCAAVLFWPEPSVDARQLRRLQLAAEAGRALGFVFGPLHLATQASPAALRLGLHPDPPELHVAFLKLRGGWAPSQGLRLRSLPEALLPAMPDALDGTSAARQDRLAPGRERTQAGAYPASRIQRFVPRERTVLR